MSKKTLRLWSVLLSVFLVVSMIPTMVFAGSEDAIEIVSQPESITASAGEQKDLSVVAENATSYQWQRSSDNGQNWSNIGSTNSNYTNAKTDTMTVKVNKTTAGFVYKCVVKNSAGSVSTEIVSITLLQQLEITAQPNNITGISGDEKVMKVTATNASSYQWQRSSDDGESWSNIGSSNVNYSNAKTAALTIKINKNTAGFVYRCVVKNSENTVNSEAATVTVILPVEIKTEPKDISSPSGEEKTMSVVAENATSYQWQRSSDNGETWSNIGSTNSNYTNAKTDTMTIKVNKTTAGFVYRCVVKNSAFTEYTREASVTVAEPAQPLEIREQPQSISGTNGSSKRITVVVDNATSYQWQRSADGENWSNISTTNSNYSGVKTQTVTVKINKNTVAYVYRCVVKNADSSVTTDVVTVSLSQSMDITEQPESISGKSGDEKTMSVAATNATSYQWQRSSDDGATWSNIGTTNSNYSGVKTEELSVKINKNTAAYIYRCVVKNDSGDSLASEVACVELKATVTITFDAKGGLIEGYPTRTETAEADSYIFNDTMIAPIRDGYTFTGWCLDPDCQTYMGFSYFVTEDLTLYAAWEENTGCTITFDANGGSFNGNPTRAETAEANSYIFNDTMISPTREGYIFDGWCLDDDCKTPMGFSYFVTEDLTLYANWIEAVYVTWNANGGYVWGNNSKPTYTEPVAKNQTIGYTQDVERNGYAFEGWYLDADCTESVDPEEYAPETDVIFYANWAAPATVIWDANGGYFMGSPDFPTYTDTVVKDEILGYTRVPECPGLLLDGWYLDAECTGEKVDVDEYVVTGDVTLYAKWAIPATVIWDANGGFFWEDPECLTYTESFPLGEINEYPNSLSKDGYVLEGWCFDAACTEPVSFGDYVVTGDITFYAKWAEAVYVTWDANGGYIWGSEEYPTYTEPVAKNQTIAYTQDVERTGYAFEGWYLDADCTEKVDPEEYAPETDVIFYANWAAPATVIWDANGGYFMGSSDFPTYIDTVVKDEVLGYTRVPERPGFVMVGWCFDAECTGEKVDVDEYVVSGNVTLYAKWVEAVSVTWDANGGYIWGDEDYPTYTEPVAKNQPIGYSQDVERYGYAFVDWYLDPECTMYVWPMSYVPTEDVTFYADWAEGVEITLDGNGGYILGDYPTYSKWICKGCVVGGLEDVERAGYVFDGWYFDADCTEPVDLSSFIPAENITLYARWGNGVNVTWDANGGSFIGMNMSSYSELVSTMLPIGGYPPVKRSGYIFDGWYLDPEYTEELDTSTYIATEDVTFYAKWADPIYVTWDANGGYFDEGTSRTESVKENSVLRVRKYNVFGLSYYIEPERDGYAFAGWYFDEQCTELVDVFEYTVEDDITFYAKWVAPVYLILDGNGGYFLQDDEMTIITKKMVEGRYVGLYMDYPSREGYFFSGWYLDIDCTVSFNYGNAIASEDVTLYAKWVEAVYVTWDGNGGFFFDDIDYLTYKERVCKGEIIYDDATIDRDGYSFGGWYFDSECTEYVDLDTFVPTCDVTLYAKWIPWSY